jgi:phosphoglucomutase
VIDAAPGNHAPIGGVKVSAASGWFAVRPSGTEDIYKIYAESFAGREAVDRILKEAEEVVQAAMSTA